MKPNYKNWMPKGMIWGTAAGCAVCVVLFLLFGVSGLLAAGALKTILKIVFLVLAAVLLLMTVWMILMYRAFSYDGKRQMSRQIIDGVAAKVVLPEGGERHRCSARYAEGDRPVHFLNHALKLLCVANPKVGASSFIERAV